MSATVRAYAKINLLLDVLGRRDDGYHEVKMIMQTIGLHDRLTLAQAPAFSLQSDNAQIPTNQSNLALKAAMLLAQEYDLPPVAITIAKNIPVAAGLAGGSTDGAAVLLGMNALYDLRLPQGRLCELAAQIGSDVPFCLAGPTALAFGRGEKLKSLPDCPKLYLVLVKPPFGVSTPSVYKQLDTMRTPQYSDWASYMQALEMQHTETLLAGMYNILEESTFALHPDVAQLKQDMRFLGGRHVLMSGSGPTVFGAFATKEEAEKFYRQCQKNFTEVFLTETMTSEELQERVTFND